MPSPPPRQRTAGAIVRHRVVPASVAMFIDKVHDVVHRLGVRLGLGTGRLGTIPIDDDDDGVRLREAPFLPLGWARLEHVVVGRHLRLGLLGTKRRIDKGGSYV